MSILQVGSPYNASVKSWAETPQYNFREGQHELTLFYHHPSQAEIDQIQCGRAEFRFVMRKEIIFFLYAFGTPSRWSDAPYTWHMLPKDQRILPKTVQPGEKKFLHIVLVDAANGLVKVLRFLTLDEKFSNALASAISIQASQAFDQKEYDHNLSVTYKMYSSHQLAYLAKSRYVSNLESPEV